MLSAATDTIRLATPADDAAPAWVADIASEDPPTAGPVLLGEIEGKPQAALSLGDGRARR